MRKIKLIFYLFSFILTTSSGIFAQQVVTTSGGIATGSGGNVSYSVGQMVNKTIVGSNGSIAQGVQQPYEISVVIGFEEVKTINLVLDIYPNPTQSQLTLLHENYSEQELTYEIHDLTGKLLLNRKITNYKSNIDLVNFPPSIYLLKVLENGKESKSFKIIKN